MEPYDREINSEASRIEADTLDQLVEKFNALPDEQRKALLVESLNILAEFEEVEDE